MEKIGTGRTADVYKDSDGTAIKLYHKDRSANFVQREADLAQKVAEVCSRAPKYLGIYRDQERLGIRYQLIEGDDLLTKMARYPPGMKEYAQDLGILHREIHTNTLTGIASMVDVFAKRLDHFDIEPCKRQRLLDFLEDHDGKTLCHGDFHPANVMMGEGGQMFVIDWSNAYYGHPLSDVARTYFLLRRAKPVGTVSILIRLISLFLQPMLARNYLKTYFHNESIPHKELRQWELFVLMGRSLEGIGDRGEARYLRKTIRRRLAQV